MELKSFFWETFTDTGDIQAYLLYKDAQNSDNNREEDNKWQTSEPKVS